MTQASPGEQRNEFSDMSLEQVEAIRSKLLQRRGGLAVNQQILFKHASALPPAKRAAVLIAGWGPVVVFPVAPILYFYEWKLALFTIFLCIFWIGMGRKFTQAVILKQCHDDGTYLKFALSVGLVKLV